MAAITPATAALWHDTAEEALEADIIAAGGAKDVGVLLWPSLRDNPIEAGKKVRRCLDAEHEQKFSLVEIDLIVDLAQRKRSRCYAAYLARRTSCNLQIVAAEDRQEELLQRWERMKAEFAQLAKEVGAAQ